MRLEEARLLIVVEDTDYRAYLSGELEGDQIANDQIATIFSQQAGESGLPKRLCSHPNAVDLNVLHAAAYWRSHVQEVGICSLYAPTPYSDVSQLGVRLIGSGLPTSFREAKNARSKDQAKDAAGDRERTRLVADFCPTHIVFCTPNYAVLSWATRNQIQSVVLLSDWQEPLGWQQQRQHTKLIKQLNHESVAWVGSHGAPACKILEASGVSSRKLIPWSWPQTACAKQYPAKLLRYDRTAVSLAYSGSLRTAAGVSDLLMAVSHLHNKGTAVHLSLIGTSADRQALQVRQQQAQQLGIAECITFIFEDAVAVISESLRAADLVVIPGYDRNRASEMPSHLRIAMSARTPIIATDHPHFKEHLLHGVNAMIFPAGNAKSMAHRIERIMSQPQLYNQLSEALDISLQAIEVPAQWAELIDRWLHSDKAMSAGADNHQSLCNWAFSSGRYQSIFPKQELSPVSARSRSQRPFRQSV